jgi:hypothetical protein
MAEWDVHEDRKIMDYTIISRAFLVYFRRGTLEKRKCVTRIR